MLPRGSFGSTEMRPPHPLDDLPRDVEAETGPTDAAGQLRVGAIEALEDLLAVVLSDPDSVVSDRELDGVVDPTEREPPPRRLSAST